MEPLPFLPTWSNGREGDRCIAKRLDRVLVAENLILSAKGFRSWIETYFLSDHSPICLHLENDVEKGNYPFKFNHSWIEEPNFKDLVHKDWTHIDLCFEVSPMIQLMNTLRTLKLDVCKWEKKKM